jgi:predicted secreted protein
MPTPTQGFLGWVKVGTAPSPTNKVSDVTDISAPLAVAQYDITSMNADANNGWSQFIAGLGSGKFTIKCNYVPGDTNGQLVLTTNFISKTILYFVISPNGTNTVTCTAYVADAQFHAPYNNKADVSYTLQLSGIPVLA